MRRRPRVAYLVAAGALIAALQALLRFIAPDPTSTSLPAVSSPAPRSADAGNAARVDEATSADGERGGGGDVGTAPSSDAAREPADAADIADPAERGESASAADAAFVEEFGEPTPALVRAALEVALAESFDGRALGTAELEQATRALVDLRTLRAELDALPMEPATAARRRVLVDALGRASESFQAVTGLSPAEFTARAAASSAAGSGGGRSGIDRDPDPDYVPVDDFIVPADDGDPGAP